MAQPASTSRCVPCCGCAGQQAGGALLLGAQEQDFPGVRVGSALLDVEVVAVVPAHHKAEVPDGRVGRRPGANGHPAVP